MARPGGESNGTREGIVSTENEKKIINPWTNPSNKPLDKQYKLNVSTELPR